MAQYIAAQTKGYIPPFGYFEGQMIPEVRAMMRRDPWSESSDYDWVFIRRVWETYLRQSESLPIFIEASPPNMMRVQKIRSVFDDVGKYVFSICDPYQQIASSLYNYAMPNLSNRINEIIIQKYAKRWLIKAGIMRSNIINNSDIPAINYENFCEHPNIINKILNIDIQEDWSIAGKQNQPVKTIRNRWRETVSFLTKEEAIEISKELKKAEGIVEYFGYKVLKEEEIEDVWTAADERFAVGLERRRRWGRWTPRRMLPRLRNASQELLTRQRREGKSSAPR